MVNAVEKCMMALVKVVACKVILAKHLAKDGAQFVGSADALRYNYC
jgi:hypothetical protein